MKKLFVSQPMNGKTDAEIMLDRASAVKQVEERLGEKVEVIDFFFKDAPHDANGLWFLGKSLELLSKADVACFVSGWNTARGCKIEYQCAVEYEVPCIMMVRGAIL